MSDKKAFDDNHRDTIPRTKPYPCIYCGMRCASSYSKMKHIHRMHEKEIKRY